MSKPRLTAGSPIFTEKNNNNNKKNPNKYNVYNKYNINKFKNSCLHISQYTNWQSHSQPVASLEEPVSDRLLHET